MRYFGLSLVTGIIAVAAVSAQNPPTQPTAAPMPVAAPATQPAPVVTLDPVNNRLDALLLAWEKKMAGVEFITAEVARTEIGKLTGTVSYQGTAKLVRPNLAMLEMQHKTNPQAWEKYICNGQFLHEYRSQDKLVRIHEMPVGADGKPASDDNFLSFLFGPKALSVKRRYELRLVKEDQWYAYLEIAPKEQADKAEFVKGRIVLFNNSFLPRQLWFEQPNQDEVKWDFPRVDTTTAINRALFVAPAAPEGWRVERQPRLPQPVPAQPEQPKTFRPQGQ